jgi:hypothetical protein
MFFEMHLIGVEPAYSACLCVLGVVLAAFLAGFEAAIFPCPSDCQLVAPKTSWHDTTPSILWPQEHQASPGRPLDRASPHLAVDRHGPEPALLPLQAGGHAALWGRDPLHLLLPCLGHHIRAQQSRGDCPCFLRLASAASSQLPGCIFCCSIDPSSANAGRRLASRLVAGGGGSSPSCS